MGFLGDMWYLDPNFFSSYNMKIFPMGKSKYVYINLNLNFTHELSVLYNIKFYCLIYDAPIHLHVCSIY